MPTASVRPKNVSCGKRLDVLCKRVDVVKDIPPDPAMAKMVDDLAGEVNKKMDQKVGKCLKKNCFNWFGFFVIIIFFLLFMGLLLCLCRYQAKWR